MLLAGLLGVPHGRTDALMGVQSLIPVLWKKTLDNCLILFNYPLPLTLFKLFLILVTAGFSPVFAVAGCSRRCCFPPFHFCLGTTGRALLSVAPHRLPRHQLPNPEATESGRSIKFDFSATNQIQSWF